MGISKGEMQAGVAQRKVTRRVDAAQAGFDELAPRIGGFIAQYPKLRLRLFSAIWADSVPGDRADIDIRFGHGKWPGYTG